MSDTKQQVATKEPLVKEWMEKNVNKYNKSERRKFFADCIDATEANIRLVQKVYARVFKPRCNLRSPDILEDNRNAGGVSIENPALAQEAIIENISLRKTITKLEAQKSILEKQRDVYVDEESLQKEFYERILEMFAGCDTQNDVTLSLLEPNGYVGIVQLSDLHFNEEISIPGNEFNFEVASARLYKFAKVIRQVFKAYKVNNLLITMTGDLMNSDRRPDEYLSNTHSRADALCFAVDLLRQFIDSLAKDFFISVTSVAGNESRIPKDWGWTDKVAGDNYDCIIFKMLSMIHASNPKIRYMFGNIVEELIKVNGTNVVITHGFKAGPSPDNFAADVRSRFAAKGKLVHYVIYGHKHVSSLGDFHGVSGSLSGSNAFGEFDLNKSCKPSQNIYLVSSDKEILGMRVDLQAAYEKDLLESFSLDNFAKNKHIIDTIGNSISID